MMRALLLLSLIALPALADDPIYAPKFGWELPTEWVSGEPLEPGDLTELRLYCDPQIEGAPIVIDDLAANEWQAPNRLFEPGNYACYVTTVAASGAESAPSNTVEFAVDADRPAPSVLFLL